MTEDYSRWGYEDLLEEIEREEESLEEKNRALRSLRSERAFAETRVRDIEAAIKEERLEPVLRRIEARSRRIRETRAYITIIEGEIRRHEESVRRRAEIIEELERTVPRPTRRISGYRGAQSREEVNIALWREILSRTRRALERDERRQVREEPLVERLEAFRQDIKDYKESIAELDEEIADLEAEASTEEAELERKREALPKLYRIKIRLYNEIEGPEGSPKGMFQGWFDVDGILDAKGMVQWDWWLTKEEISIAKTHMVGYFKGMAKWASPEDIGQAYQTSLDGIPYGDKTATYARTRLGVPLTKGIPSEYVRKAEQMKVADLIVGESSVEPKPNLKPEAENMGVYFQQALILNPEGRIKWQERRSRWVWHPPDDYVKKVKEELAIEGE